MQKNYCNWLVKIRKNEKLSKLGSFFMLNEVINDCQGGKIIDVAIFISAMKRSEESEGFEVRIT